MEHSYINYDEKIANNAPIGIDLSDGPITKMVNRCSLVAADKALKTIHMRNERPAILKMTG